MTVSPVRMAKIIKFNIFRSSLFRLFHWPDVNREVCFDKESEMDNYVTFLVPPSSRQGHRLLSLCRVFESRSESAAPQEDRLYPQSRGTKMTSEYQS